MPAMEMQMMGTVNLVAQSVNMLLENKEIKESLYVLSNLLEQPRR